MAIAYSVRVRGGGTDSFHGFEYFCLITLTSREFRVLLAVLPARLQCLRIFGLRQCCMVLRPHLYCLPSRFTIVRYLYWFLGLYGVGPVFSVALALIARTIPAPVLVPALRRVANVAVFSPIPWFFTLVLGPSVLAYEILALPLLFLGYVCGVAFFCSVCLSSAYLYPTVAGLVGFSCGPPSLVVPV